MASPTPPILSAIVTESLKRSGYAKPSEDLQARAAERWIEEIKAEVWAKARKLKALQARGVTVLVKGLSQYSNPSDYASDMSIVFATGARFGTAQAGTTTSVTLAVTDGYSEADSIGKEVVFVSGTGVGGMSTITAFNTTSKVATISPAVTTAPASGTGYLVLDDYRQMAERPIWDASVLTANKSKGYPDVFFPSGDATNGKFTVYPIPWRDDAQPMVLIHNYQADLTEADISGALLSTLYQKWQPLWIAGIRWKCLQGDDDNRAGAAFQEYQKALKDITGADTYGNTLNDLQLKVVDY